MKGLVLVLVGCTSSHTEPPAAVQPRACAANLNLVGAVSTSPREVGPYAFDTNGVSLCMNLDATQLTRAHMMASTNQIPGDSSGLEATLEHTDLTTILEGWDVDVSNGTFLNVEWSPPAGQLTQVVLWVRAASVPVTTKLAIDLFDPLE